MKPIELRPCQIKIINDLRDCLRHGHRRICVVAPCGFGKTAVMGWITDKSRKKGSRIIFFVHRRELVEQAADTFRRFNVPFGIIAAGVKPDYSQPVQIASVQTLTKRIHKIPAPDIMICDECHHIKARSYMKIIDNFPKSWLIGTTATPVRTDGKPLGDVFGEMVIGARTRELIVQGYLTGFDYFAPTLADFSKVRIICGDYDSEKVEKMMVRRKIVGDVVENYKKYADGKSAICYCVTTKHSQMVSKAFNDAGIPAAHCDYKTPKDERARLVEDFRAGKILVFCNVNLFGEGFDVPNAHAVILARPTKSLTLYIQQAMRAMRPDPNDPNKQAVIIDHVENYKRHGYPDADFDWSLKRIPGAPDHTKKCPKCGEIVEWGTRVCPCCGSIFAITSHVNPYRSSVVEVGGRLDMVYSCGKSALTAITFRKAPIISRYDEFLVEELGKHNINAVEAALARTLEYAQSSEDFELLLKRTKKYSFIWEWRAANGKI